MAISYQERYINHIEFSTPKNIEELHIYMFCSRMGTQTLLAPAFYTIEEQSAVHNFQVMAMGEKGFISEEQFIQELNNEPIKSILKKFRELTGLSFKYGNPDMFYDENDLRDAFGISDESRTGHRECRWRNILSKLKLGK